MARALISNKCIRLLRSTFAAISYELYTVRQINEWTIILIAMSK